MDDKEYILEESEPQEGMESLEITKEIKTLSELKEEREEDVETLFLEDFDEQLAVAEEEFEEKVSEKNQEEPNDKKKENVFKKLKDKWTALSKKNKILLVGITLLILILIILLITFLLRVDEVEETPKAPDVILESENYRYENGKLIFLEGTKELGTYACENKSETLCMVAKLNQNDTMDKKRQVDESGAPLNLVSRIYYERYVFIYDNKTESDTTIKLYDIKNEKEVKKVFSIIADSSYKDYVILKDEEGNFGLEKISKDEIVSTIPYSYDEINFIPNQQELSLLAVRKDNNSYLANLENKILTKAINTTIVGANDKYLKAKDVNGKYHVYDYNAKEVVEGDKDYVELLNNILLEVKDNALYVKDYDGYKMAPEGLSLKNSLYNPTETYKNGKLIKTEKAFEYQLDGNNLSIDIYENDAKENRVYNLYEGNLSKNFAYMDYFNGYLFFYKDVEKKERIGSYQCDNPNTIESGTTALTNCKPATESVFKETRNEKEKALSNPGVIPMFGEKYLFIQDGNTIVLQDITTSGNPIAKYESVDTSSYTNSNDITHVTTSNVPFIAKSASSSKFGVANITDSGVKPVIPFEKDSIKILGDYYVVEEKGKYTLYSLDGVKVEMEEKNSPIVDYHKKYLKTYKDNMYFVHSFDKGISNTAYNYVELYDNFYAAVLNGKVHLYRYDDNAEKPYEYIYESDGEEKSDGIKLVMTKAENFYGNEVNAFRITFDSKSIYVEIGNTNNTYGKKMSFPLNKRETGTKPSTPPTGSSSEEGAEENEE